MAIESVRFELIPDWEKCPAGEEFAHKDVVAVACDSQDRVYLHTRYGDRVMIYREDGRFIGKWGDGVFGSGGAHGLTIHNDTAYATSHVDSVVRIFDLEGNLKQTLGQVKQPSDTGYMSHKGPYKIGHNETVVRVAGPFNCCCNCAIARNGDIFVADGYGNARIHRFSADGRLQHSFGEIGTGPGQFHLPHGIALDNDENIIVCDRENDRLQFFDRNGKYLTMWTDVRRPTDAVVDKDGLIYVSELWRPVEKAQGSFVHGFADHDLPGRVTVFRKDGKIVARFGDDSNNRAAPGNFIAPHGLTLDSRGNLYVGEVSTTFGAMANRMPPEPCLAHQVQKFARVG